MAVYLVCIDGPATGRRWRLRPGTWTLGSDAGCDFPLTADLTLAPRHARLEVSAKRIQIEPVGEAEVVVNGAPASAPVSLRPGDRLRLAGTVLRLEQAQTEEPAIDESPVLAQVRPAPPPQPTAMPAEPFGVALPPPDPPRWRTVLGVLAIVAAVAAVALVVRLVPKTIRDPAQLLTAETRERVRAGTVWIRGDGGLCEGSGFVSKSGWVVTNAHVVMDVRSVDVVFNAGTDQVRQARAQILKMGQPGRPRDIALLKVDTGNAPALSLTDPASLPEGSHVVAFGYPLGAELSTNRKGPSVSIRGGSVTALRRDDRGRVQWVETDIAVEVGNSGGPAVTMDGKVVGLATMLVGPHLKTALVAPSNLIKEFAPTAVQ